MAYDDIILMTGGFGRHQRRIYALLCLSSIPYAFQTMAGVFLAAETDFRCLLPHERPENATYQLSSNLTNTFHPGNYEDQGQLHCKRYDVHFIDQFNDSNGNFSFTNPAIKCDAFVYDKTTYELTTTTEFNLVCDNAWLRATADSLFMVGALMGSMIFGGLSDIHGRRTIFYWSLCLQAISGLLVAASPEIISYMIFRLILASAGSGVFQLSYVSAIEMVVPEHRSLSGMGIQISFTLGYVLTAGFAYFITNWRILQIALTVPSLACLVYWWFIPESIRWLLSKGRLEEAKYFIEKASFENGVELSRITLDAMLRECSVSQSDPEEFSIFDLLRYPNLRRKSLLLFFNTLVINSTYFGLAWNTSSLVGSDYINFVISGLVEVPAFLVFFTLNVWGRKSSLCGSTLLSGIFLLLRMFVPDDISWLDVTLTMMGKFAITAATVTVYVFVAEQYPTVIRNTGVGACTIFGSIGGILSPYFNYSSAVWRPLPVVILGSSSLITGFLALLLPETLGQKLPESIQDGEQFGKRSVELDKKSGN